MNQKPKQTDEKKITLESIYSNLSPTEIAKVAINLERYLQLMLRMHARLNQSPSESYAQPPALTEN